MSFCDFFEKLFFPFDCSCNICKSEDKLENGLCAKCISALERSEGERCEICLDRISTRGRCAACLKKKPDYEKAFCSYTYSGEMRKLIHAFKFARKRYLRHVLAPLMQEAIDKSIAFDVIIPVPLTSGALKKRGYNQAAELARELEKTLEVPVREDVLFKNKSSAHMAQLNKVERRKNIKGLYFCRGELTGETVLLIDDVITTGETLRACAHELKRAGAGKIYCASVARTDLKD